MKDSRCRMQNKKNHVSCIMYHAPFLLFVISCLFFASCAPKKIALPDYEGVDVKTVIAERDAIKRVKATLSVEYEKDDSVMSGDAALELTDNTLDLRIYSFGFLVAELKERNGVIKSNPELSRNKSVILVEGLRNSILWWMIRNYEVEEQNGMYLLKNFWQKILVDKKTMLPTFQKMELDMGELRIFYDKPMYSGRFWFQSKMRIELLKYIVRLEIKTISFLSHRAQDQQQQHL